MRAPLTPALRLALLVTPLAASMASAQQPVDVACASGVLFVLDASPPRIWRVDGAAMPPVELRHGEESPDLGHPTRMLAVGDQLLLADPHADHVLAVDIGTGAVRPIDAAPVERLRQPSGLALHPDGRVVVADTGNHRLLTLARADDGDGSAPWRFADAPLFTERWPFDVACGADGAVYAI
ncbi:MAG: hypothetical protein KDE27_27465, partial [Planctomycetes bacterium]|nr:hypothetical protein [Planctomycetota bacterium]